ncbi:MAG: hypothetical protein KC620_07540 [Myxococcales bacterium]|nr:hypothetical protein [Myxococcales bacterium]
MIEQGGHKPVLRAFARLGLAAALLLPAMGHAQGDADAPAAAPTEAPPLSDAEIDVLKEMAAEALRTDAFETALGTYRQLAEGLAGQPERHAERITALFLAAVCLENLGRLPEAADALRGLLLESPPQSVEARARDRLAAIEPLLPIPVNFVCDDQGVMITIEALGPPATPCENAVPLTPGTYRARAEAPDGRATTLTVNVTPGMAEDAVVLLPPPIGASPEMLARDKPPPPPPPPTRLHLLEWGLTAGAVGCFVAGGVLNAAARDDIATADDAYQRYLDAIGLIDRDTAASARRETEAARDDGELKSWISYGLFGAGLALAGLAAWQWFEDDPAETGAVLTPIDRGVGLTGRW